MEYEVVWKLKDEDLMAVVRKMIGEGWRPQGGIAATDMAFFQAMVRDSGNFRKN